MTDGYFIEGYLAESGQFIPATKLPATARNRELILSGRLIPLRKAEIPPAISEWKRGERP